MTRKYLMTAMAFVALGGLFSGCTREIEGGEGNSAAFDIVQKYETAFITRFGQPAETQTWGFGPISSGTRAVMDNPTVEYVGPTFNATITTAVEKVAGVIDQNDYSFMNRYASWIGSNWTDNFYQIHGTVENSGYSEEDLARIRNIILNEIPENIDNRNKISSTNYTVTTTGENNGYVTLTPIYHNSSSGDLISYYYYPANTNPTIDEIKAMPKYTIGNITDPAACAGSDETKHLLFDHKTYYLVYDADGPDGPIAPTHVVPEGIKINFIISNNDLSNGTVEIYNGDAIPSGLTLTSQASYAVEKDKTYACGESAQLGGKAEIKFGNSIAPPKFTGPVEASASERFTYNNHEYKWLMNGNGVNGSLLGGCTAYYFKADGDGTINIGIRLPQTKTLSVKDLGYDLNNRTNPTSHSDMDGWKYSDTETYKGICSFSVVGGKWYAVYAEGSKLGYYGFEFTKSDGTVETNGILGGTLWDFSCGEEFKMGSVLVKVGISQPYFNTTQSDNSHFDDYKYYTRGTQAYGADSNGNLVGGGTVYYFRPYYCQGESYIRVAVKLDANAHFYVKDLGACNNDNDAWKRTTGTTLDGFDGITKTSDYFGTFDFPIETDHIYAVYSSDSRLALYGCQYLVHDNSSSQSASNVPTTNIDNYPEFYGYGELNTEVHQCGVDEIRWIPVRQGAANNTSHIAVFSIGDKNYVGFEDWTDFDYNDVIFEITGTEGGEEIEIEEEPGPICRIIAEDLTVDENGDFDFNDVVFDVCPDAKNNKTTLIIRCVGGELPLYIAQSKDDPLDESREVHNVCGLGPMQMTNTGWDGAINYNRECGRIVLNGTVISSRAEARSIAITVVKKNETIELSAVPGRVPSKICVGTDYRWCPERKNIDDIYHTSEGDKLFSDYVVGYLGDDWYKNVQIDQSGQ